MPTYWSGNTVTGTSGGEAAGAGSSEYAKAAAANYKKTGQAFYTGSVLGLTPAKQLYVAESMPTAAPTDAERILHNPSVVQSREFMNPASDYGVVTEQTGSSQGEPNTGMMDKVLSGMAIPIVIIIIAIALILTVFRR